MNKTWYSISNIKCDSNKIISANAIVLKNSRWFSGHFPGEPILPGIAQLSMVFDVISECYNKNKKNLIIAALKKVRFKFPVKPEELLNISVHSNKKLNTYSFEITTHGEIACSGIITVK